MLAASPLGDGQNRESSSSATVYPYRLQLQGLLCSTLCQCSVPSTRTCFFSRFRLLYVQSLSKLQNMAFQNTHTLTHTHNSHSNTTASCSNIPYLNLFVAGHVRNLDQKHSEFTTMWRGRRRDSFFFSYCGCILSFAASLPSCSRWASSHFLFFLKKRPLHISHEYTRLHEWTRLPATTNSSMMHALQLQNKLLNKTKLNETKRKENRKCFEDT